MDINCTSWRSTPCQSALRTSQYLNALDIKHLLVYRIGIHNRLIPICGNCSLCSGNRSMWYTTQSHTTTTATQASDLKTRSEAFQVCKSIRIEIFEHIATQNIDSGWDILQ